MSIETVLSVGESMMFPDFGELYQARGWTEYKVSSVRKATSLIKKQSIDLIVAEFVYAYSTNYSGIYKSNLEVLLVSLTKYSPNTKVIVLANKKDIQYLDVLKAVDYPIYGSLQLPADLSSMEQLLSTV